jgi:hypothetical protein
VDGCSETLSICFSSEMSEENYTVDRATKSSYGCRGAPSTSGVERPLRSALQQHIMP